MADLTINGLDAAGANYGFQLAATETWRDAPMLEVSELRVPGVPGSIVVQEIVPPKVGGFRGFITGSSHADALAKRSNFDTLLRLARPGRFEFGDAVGKVYHARVTGLSFTTQQPEHIATTFDVAVKLHAAEPFARASSTTSVTSITTGSAIAQGTLPPWPYFVLKVQGAATNPAWTFKNADGDTIATLGFTLSLTGSEWLVVDLVNKRAYKNTTGAVNSGTNVINLWTSGSFFFPAVEVTEFNGRTVPDWDPIAATSPSLALSSGTGQAEYIKAYAVV